MPKGHCNIYECKICGFKGKKSEILKHGVHSHYDLVKSMLDNSNVEITDYTLNTASAYLYWGFDEIMKCPNCGKPFIHLDNFHRKDRFVKRYCECGYSHKVESWSESISKWRSENIDKIREQAHNLGKEYGKITGVKNLINYNNNPEYESIRKSAHSKNGKLYGIENLNLYNTLPKYEESRRINRRLNIEKREMNSDYILKRSLSSNLNTLNRAKGFADLYIMLAVEKDSNKPMVKVGYSRNFIKFRKPAYIEYFDIKDCWISNIEAVRVLEFEEKCHTMFNFDMPKKRPYNIGRTEWYKYYELEKILKLADELGIVLNKL